MSRAVRSGSLGHRCAALEPFELAVQLQSLAVEIEVQTGEDHDTTTLSRDEGSHWWFYPERPLEPGGQFISPTGQFSPEPACPKEEKTADKARTEDKGQRTGERDVTQNRRVHIL